MAGGGKLSTNDGLLTPYLLADFLLKSLVLRSQQAICERFRHHHYNPPVVCSRRSDKGKL